MSDRRIPPANKAEDTPATPLPTQTFHRLSQTALGALTASLPPAMPSSNTTDIQAGFMLGIQHTLNLLRNGFVVGA